MENHFKERHLRTIKIIRYINVILAIFTLFYAVKGIFFNELPWEDIKKAFIISTVLCLLNGVKGIIKNSPRLEVIGDFFGASLLILSLFLYNSLFN